MINPVSSKLGITEVVLRDGNQSLLATRIKTEDLLPIASALDEKGFAFLKPQCQKQSNKCC